jgi:predicted glycoside hydrolase/deacetylase ChbG (UPF0249 family)
MPAANAMQLSSPTTRTVLLHADDYGMNDAVTRGIVEGFRHGLLTSTSLLANAPAAEFALERWRILETERATGALPSTANRQRLNDTATTFDLGIHINLTQGRPLTGDWFPSELLDANGQFLSVGRLFAQLAIRGNRYREAITAELAAQIARMIDHGLPPSHLNGHQYIELMPIVRNIVPELLDRFHIPAVRLAYEPGLLRTTLVGSRNVAQWGLATIKRHFARRFRHQASRLNLHTTAAFFGTAHAGRIDLPIMQRFLKISRHATTIEIGLHPGQAVGTTTPTEIDECWHDPLATLRPVELQMLQSDKLIDLLASQQLSLGRLSRLGKGHAGESPSPAAIQRAAG